MGSGSRKGTLGVIACLLHERLDLPESEAISSLQPVAGSRLWLGRWYPTAAQGHFDVCFFKVHFR